MQHATLTGTLLGHGTVLATVADGAGRSWSVPEQLSRIAAGLAG
jgi:hypothetical protein